MTRRTFGIVFLAWAFPLLAAGNETSPDTLTIVSVEPSGPVTRGVPIEAVVTVDVTIGSADEAMARLGFNTQDPGGFRMTASHLVRRGTTRIVLKANVTPVDWAERGQFMAMVNVGPNKPGDGYSPTALARHVFEVVP